MSAYRPSLLEAICVLDELLRVVENRRYLSQRHRQKRGGQTAGTARHRGDQHAADKLQLVPLKEAPKWRSRPHLLRHRCQREQGDGLASLLNG